MVAKGNRAVAVREACKKHGGFYLGSIGGAAANLAEHCIKKVEVVEYPELGMEAIWRIEVVDFPAFIIIDDKGNDFFKELNLRVMQVRASMALVPDNHIKAAQRTSQNRDFFANMANFRRFS